MIVTLKLNDTEIAVLIRCFNYGENAISEIEEKDGTANMIRSTIENIRKRTLTEVSKSIIDEVINSAF
jgi:hypothetical protein